MQELITFHNVEFDGTEQRSVNARDLHSALQIKSEFRNWIKNRIADFGFLENQDFVTFGKNLPNGGKTKEYFISINMAKELCMVERNELGRMWRAHFIKCEKDLMEIKQQQTIAVPQTLPEALRLANTKRDDCLALIAYHSLKDKEQVLNTRTVATRKGILGISRIHGI